MIDRNLAELTLAAAESDTGERRIAELNKDALMATLTPEIDFHVGYSAGPHGRNNIFWEIGDSSKRVELRFLDEQPDGRWSTVQIYDGNWEVPTDLEIAAVAKFVYDTFPTDRLYKDVVSSDFVVL